jgi:hypothetical protein
MMEIMPIVTSAGPGAIAQLALAPGEWKAAAAHELARSIGPDAINDAIALVRQQFAPVPSDDDRRAEWAVAMDERLRRIALKVSPGMSPAQAAPWRGVMVEALADLPAMVALTAAKRALHIPMQFMNQIEPAIRDAAAQVLAERNLAIERLRRLAVQRKQATMPRLEDRRGDPLTVAEIAAMPPALREMGRKAGAITLEQILSADQKEQHA